MLRIIIPASLAFSCITPDAAAEPSAPATKIVLAVPAEKGKPAELNDKEKARLESRLQELLLEMTITPTSLSWNKKQEMEVILPAMGEVVRVSVVKKITQEAILQKGLLSLHHLHPENRKIIARIRLDGIENVMIPGYSIRTMVTTDDDDNPVSEFLVIQKKAILDSNLIRHAQELHGPQEGKILVELNKEGAKKMFDATSKIRHGLDRIAIILDGKVLSAPTVQDTLGAQFEISGMKDAAEAKDIATALMAPVSKALTVKSINPPLAK